MTITGIAPRPQPVTGCGYPDPATIGNDDTGVAQPALRHLAGAAIYASRILGRNSCYQPQDAIDTLCTTIAATTVIAGHTAAYAGDFWPATTAAIDEARQLLARAGALLDSARHTAILTVPEGGLGDAPADRYQPPAPITPPDTTMATAA